MLEDWFFVLHMYILIFKCDEQHMSDTKTGFNRLFLDAIYNDGLIQELYKKMGKRVKRYLFNFDNIFTINYDNNLERLTHKEVFHLHGSFEELQETENEKYVLGYLRKQKNEFSLIDGYEHCFSNALLNYSGKLKLKEADLKHRLIQSLER